MMRTEICLRGCIFRLKTALLADLELRSNGGGVSGDDSLLLQKRQPNEDGDNDTRVAPSRSLSQRRLQLNSLHSCASLARLHAGTFDTLDADDDDDDDDDDDGICGLAEDEGLDSLRNEEPDVRGSEDERCSSTEEVGHGQTPDLSSSSSRIGNCTGKSRRQGSAVVVKQLLYEVNFLRKQVEILTAENAHFRGMLTQIGSLAELAVSKEPPVATIKKASAGGDSSKKRSGSLDL